MDTPRSNPQADRPIRLAMLAGPETMPLLGPVVRQLTVGLMDEAVRVLLVAPDAADMTGLPTPPVELLRHTIDRARLISGRKLDSLAQQLIEREIDLLHGLDGASHRLLAGLAQRCDLPQSQWVVSLEQARHIGSHPVADQNLLCASLLLRAEVLRTGAVPAERTGMLRPGVQRSRQSTCFTDPERAASLLCTGRFERYEPYAAVLDAFAALAAAGADCVFFMIGAGPAERKLRHKAEKLGLNERLTFASPLPGGQMAGIFKSADVLIYPQSDGQIEMDVLLAMAAGTAVVYGGPCVGDFVQDGQTAMAYDRAAKDDLARRLQVLLADRLAARALADQALDYLRERHSPASMVSEAVQLYRAQALRQRTLRLG